MAKLNFQQVKYIYFFITTVTFCNNVKAFTVTFDQFNASL